MLDLVSFISLSKSFHLSLYHCAPLWYRGNSYFTLYIFFQYTYTVILRVNLIVDIKVLCNWWNYMNGILSFNFMKRRSSSTNWMYFSEIERGNRNANQPSCTVWSVQSGPQKLKSFFRWLYISTLIFPWTYANFYFASLYFKIYLWILARALWKNGLAFNAAIFKK